MAAENLTGIQWLDDVLKTLPASLLENVYISPDGSELHYPDDLRGNADLLRLYGLMRDRLDTKAFGHPMQEYALKYRRASTLALDVSDQSAVQRELVGIIREAYNMQASDVHITDMGSYGLLEYRIMGEMRRIRDLSSQDAARLVAVAFNGLGQATDSPSFTAILRGDARIASRRFLPANVHSVRLHSEPIQSDAEAQGVFLAMRLLYDATQAHGGLEDRLHSLGFSQDQTRTIRRLTAKSGLNVIAGATGHGKSTALKHIMESMVAERPDRAYFSVEDPPEYPIVGIHQIQVVTNERDDGIADARGRAYTDAIAGAMRSDPDTIMVGEVRYPEAASAAIDAALTGHSVWTTIHASDAFTIVTRLESLLRSLRIPNPLDVICDANVLSGLSYQRLVGLLCPHCRRRWADLSAQERAASVPMGVQRRLKRVIDAFRDRSWNAGSVWVRNPGGCKHCRGLGLSGRSAAAETVDVDQQLLDVLHTGDKAAARRTWMNRGHDSYVDSALKLVFSGMADPVVAESCLGTTIDSSIPWHQAKSGVLQGL